MEFIEYIKMAGIIIGSMSMGVIIIYFGFKYYFNKERKEKAKSSIRETKRIVPEGWSGNLIKVIIDRSQKTIINEGFSIIHIWQKGKYILTCKELLNTNDNDHDITRVGYPILTSFVVTIEEKRRILPKLITYISIDRTRPNFRRDELDFQRDVQRDYFDFQKNYFERLNKKPNVYIKGEKVI